MPTLKVLKSGGMRQIGKRAQGSSTYLIVGIVFEELSILQTLGPISVDYALLKVVTSTPTPLDC